MKPTSIIIRRLGDQTKPTRAYVDITFDEVLVVKDFRIVMGKNGLFLGMPSKSDKAGKFHDTVYIANSMEDGPGKEFREKLQAYVLKQYGSEETPVFTDQTKQQRPTRPSGAYTDDLPF